MNKLVIPPSPNWYETNVMTCGPDGTLVYGAYTSLVIVEPKTEGKPADIRIIPFAHNQRVITVSLNPNWNEPQKLVVSTGEDKSIKLWSCDTLELVLSHKAHSANETRLIGASFAGHDKVVSVSEDGLIIVWKISNNEMTPLKNLLGQKVQVTCFSSCPHAPWLFSFGLNNGIIIVADLRVSGQVKHRMKCYDKKTLSLAWCPIPVNVFPKPKINKISLQQKCVAPKITADEHPLDPCSSKVDTKATHRTVLPKKINPWINLKHADDDDFQKSDSEQPEETQSDFLKECEELTEKIKSVKDENGHDEELNNTKDRKILIARKNRVSDILNDVEKLVIDDVTGDENEKDDLYKIEKMEKANGDETVEHLDTEIKEPGEKLLNKNQNDLHEDGDKLVITKLKIEEEADDEKVENVIEKILIDNEVKADNEKTHLQDDPNDNNLLIKKLVTADVHEASPKSQNGDESLETPTSYDIKTENGTSLSECENEACSSSSGTDEKNKMDRPTKEFLLASASSKGSITVWRAGTDGKVQLKLALSGPSNSRYGKGRDRLFWIAMSWVSPTVLLTSGRKGELLQWNLTDAAPQPKTVHNDHQSVLFSIATPFHKNPSLENWCEPSGLAAWTIGQERALMQTTVDLQRMTLCCYPTLGTSVQAFAVSPTDPHKVAIGMADGSIRIWDLSRPHIDCITMTTFKAKSSARITALSWHSDEEAVVAFGTEEGHIGLINATSPSKPPTLFVHHFRSTIHHLEWGSIKEQTGVFACSEGILVFYDMKKPLQDPFQVDIPRDKHVTQFAWKPDNSLLAVGTKEGHVLVFSRDFACLATIFHQQKSVVSLSWHCTATAADEGVSQNEFLLASASIDGYVAVYNLRNCHNGVEDVSKVIVAQLNEHYKYVHSISWSPHEGGKLVTASEDGSAHVWNVADGSVKCTFLNVGLQPITACIWSPVDKDLIVCGGRESSIRVWNINDYQPLKQIAVMKEAEKYKIKSQPVARPKETGHQGNKKNASRDSILSTVSSRQGDTDSLLKDCELLLRLKQSAGDDRDEIIGSSSVLQLFGNREDVQKLLQHQRDQHSSRGKNLMQQHLSLWSGDLAETIRSAIVKEQLSPWLISMASTVSPTLWQEACLAYAKHLEENSYGDGLEAASYYLACHKVDEAISVLCSKNLFREALALSKCRMANSEGITDEILSKWALFYLTNGSYEIATQCFIMMGKFEDAAKALFKRSDVKCLEMAVKLAELADNPEMLSAIRFRYNAFLSDSSPAEDKVLPSRAEAVFATSENGNLSSESTSVDENVAAIVENGLASSGSSSALPVIAENGNVSEELRVNSAP